MKFLFAVTFIIVLSQSAQRTEAIRSNGVIRRCGNNAREFLQWFCMDESFTFPFSTHSSIILILSTRYHLGREKGIYPFFHLAVKCCKDGCLESDYQKMCDYHKKIQRCERRQQYRKKIGKKRRFCRMNPSLLI